jgi:prepilin-type N-terminal cleavage/methylation domain-containing protein
LNLPHRKSSTGSKRGFSLAELMAVVAVMGLIASVVAANFMASLPRAQKNSALHGVAAAISAARSDSIARNGEFRIYYDIDANSYTVSSPYKSGGGVAQSDEERLIVKRALMPDSISIERVTIDNLDYTEGQVFVAFTPSGRATGHTLLLMQAPMEAATTVEVLPLTGLVRFYDGDFVREPVTEEDFD